jgi:hypothetical protein
VVEGKAVIDNVIRPHPESIVHQGSHAVIPGKAQSKRFREPLEWQEEAARLDAGPPPPWGTCPLPAVYHNGSFG